MIDVIRAEITKLKTLRYTYYTFFGMVLLMIFLGFYVNGINGSVIRSATDNLYVATSTSLSEISLSTLYTFALVPIVFSILCMTNEFRHNMISNTLLSARRRYEVLLAKAVACSIYTITLSFVMYMLFVGSVLLGAKLGNYGVVAQDGHSIFTGLIKTVVSFEAFALLGLVLATVLRSLAVSIIAYIIFPGILEVIVMVFVKSENLVVYLTPFNGIGNLMGPRVSVPSQHHVKGALVFFAYLIVFWLIATWLFERRDTASN